MRSIALIIIGFSLLNSPAICAHSDWSPKPYAAQEAHAPTPLPDRVILTWESDPATTQSVTWRTDSSIKEAIAQIARASANGRAMEPTTIQASTSRFESDINTAHYHTAKFLNLEPDTLYAYRVGDGVNWSEYYHFKTASDEERPFSFIYFGDAQNDVRTHWSRVFREAFRDAPRAAFTLHAGDLIDIHDRDAEWGDWHQAPDWVNATVPIIATPGNHEYRRINQGPRFERFWMSNAGKPIEVILTAYEEIPTEAGTTYQISAMDAKGNSGALELNDGGVITAASSGISDMTGFSNDQLLGSSYYRAPLADRQRQPGDPAVSLHWRAQFAFPIQDVPQESLKETVYYIDYQGTRFISLNSTEATESQIAWLRSTLENNHNTWTVVTFHHPMFSPATDRDNPKLREQWKPLLDEFKVDLVLNGHDHTYARTGQRDSDELLENVPSGYQQAYDPAIGTVYVVSVSGPKMYKITKGNFAKRTAENTQLYQIVDIDKTVLRYRAYTATGELYDQFELHKREEAPNLLVESFAPLSR